MIMAKFFIANIFIAPAPLNDGSLFRRKPLLVDVWVDNGYIKTERKCFYFFFVYIIVVFCNLFVNYVCCKYN